MIIKFEVKQFKLFATALLQVFFVNMNIIFVSSGMLILMILTGFMISFIWTLNVKSVAFGSWKERFTYALGASIGTGLGYWFSNFIVSLLNS